MLDEFWADEVEGYRKPGFIVVDGATNTACGTASNAVGPFFCPGDETVYIDPTFFQLMQEQFGASAGELAQLYIVGHEWGHHIQWITGVMDDYPNNGTGPGSNGVPHGTAGRLPTQVPGSVGSRRRPTARAFRTFSDHREAAHRCPERGVRGR